MEAALLELLQQAKETGLSASLSFTTVGGAMKAKFEIELASTGSSPASPTSTPTATSTAPGGERRHRRRRRHRGPAAVARSQARAAAHQASLAAAKVGTATVLPPPLRLQQVLVKPRNKETEQWRQRRGGLLSLVNTCGEIGLCPPCTEAHPPWRVGPPRTVGGGRRRQRGKNTIN